MFDIPAIPYVVFALLVLPPIIIGFFRGWRASLLILVTLLITSGLIVGISAALYDKLNWPLFKHLFIDKYQSSNIDIEKLAYVVKPSVIMLSLGVFLIPCVLVTFGVYKLSKKVVQRYMYPDVTVTDSNVKEVKRKDLRRTKVLGTTIGTVTGLGVASVGMSSIAVVTTGSQSASWVNSFASGLSSVYSFGQASYDRGYQALYEFLDAEKSSSQIGVLNKMLNPTTANITAGEVVSLNEIGFNHYWNNLSEYDDEVIGLLKAIETTTPKLDLFKLDPNYYQGISKAFVVKPKLGLSAEAVNLIIKHIKVDKLKTFESTKPFLDWKHAGEFKKSASEKLKAKKDARTLSTLNLKQHTHKKDVNIDNVKRQDIIIKDSNIKLPNLIATNNSLNTIKNQKHNTASIAESLKDHAEVQWNNAKRIVVQTTNDIKREEGVIKTKKNILSAIPGKLIAINKTIKKNKHEIDSSTTNAANLSTAIGSVQSQISAEKIYIASLEQKLSAIDPDMKTTTVLLSTAKASLVRTKASLRSKQTELSRITAIKFAKTNENTALSNEIARQTQIQTQTTSDLASEKQNLSLKKTRLITQKQTSSTAKAEYDNKTAIWTPLNNNYIQAKKNSDAAADALNKEQQRHDGAINSKSISKRVIKLQTTNIKNDHANLTRLGTDNGPGEVRTAITTLATASSDLISKEKVKNIKADEYATLVKRYLVTEEMMFKG